MCDGPTTYELQRETGLTNRQLTYWGHKLNPMQTGGGNKRRWPPGHALAMRTLALVDQHFNTLTADRQALIFFLADKDSDQVRNRFLVYAKGQWTFATEAEVKRISVTCTIIDGNAIV